MAGTRILLRRNVTCAPASPLYLLVGACSSWPVVHGLLPAARARAREPARRAASCSPPTTPRTSTRGRSGCRSCRAGSSASWRSRSFSSRRSARSCAAGGAFQVRRGEGDVEAMRDGDRARPRRATSSRCSRRGRGERRGCVKKHKPRPHTGAARIALDGGRAARPGGDRGHRPPRAPRARSGSPTGRPSSSPTSRTRAARGGPSGDRAADGRDRAAQGDAVSQPLLVVDGDSLAHRAYHALPKSIRRARGGPPARSSASRTCSCGSGRRSEPRAVLVGWDTLTVPTYRHEAFARVPERARVRRRAARAARPAARARRGRSASRTRRRRATRPTTSSPPRWRSEEERGGTAARRHLGPRRLPARQRRGRRSCSRCAGVSELARIGPGRGARALRRRARSRCPTSSRSAAIPPTSFPARRGVGPKTAADDAARVRLARGRARRRADSRRRRRICGSTGELRRWTPPPPPSPRRPGPDVGGGVLSRARAGA